MKLISDKIDNINTGTTAMGLTTGNHQLDEVMRGLQGSNLIVVAGRSSMGKSSYVLGLALSVPCPVLFFSSEMSFEQLQLRALSSVSGVSHHKISNDELNDDEREQVTAAAEVLKNKKILIDDQCNKIFPLDYQELKKTKYPKNSINVVLEKGIKFGCGLVIFDQLQQMHFGGWAQTESLRIHKITWALHELSKRHDIPILLVSQLRRFDQERYKKSKSPRPRLDDLRESGDIEQDANVVLLLHRPGYYELKDEIDLYSNGVEDAEIIVSKNRNGATGIVKVRWCGSTMSWLETEDF